ncbi:tRNA dihydrouridine synthase DusB [Kiritimatiellaeota bacterium B1221]|nr:tRNA dihydrouridine synthase DusB [Kiritimatiellaeota bacterium B1221]
MLNKPFQLGNLEIPNGVLLAPLAGVSDVPFRRICQELGAGLTYIEMLSAAGMPHHNRKAGELIARDASEPVLGAQMTGAKPEIMALGAKILMEKGVAVDTLDINMGCPVKKIVGRGCGSAIVRDPKLAGEILQATIEAVDIPVTTKIRLGFTKSEQTVEDVSAALAKAGSEMLVIHGRTRDCGYSDPVQYDRIKDGFEAARNAAGDRKIQLVGNGNIFDLKTAKEMVDKTGCDGVMISRGCLGNPWIFDQILNEHERQPTVSEWLDVVLRHVEYHREFYTEGHYAAIRFRKHLLWYVSGYPGSRALRAEISQVNSMAEVRERLLRYADVLPDELRRYGDPHEFAKTGAYDPKTEMDRDHDRGIEHYEDS